MEQAIRAELWQVLDTSDLDSVTSKEVGRVSGRERLALPWGLPHLAFLQPLPNP